MSNQPPFCPTHGLHEGMQCPQCAPPVACSSKKIADRLRHWLGHPACSADSVQADLRDAIAELDGIAHETAPTASSEHCDTVGGCPELRAARQKIERLRESLRDWIAANAPGGWIDDLRKQVNAQRKTHADNAGTYTGATVETDARRWPEYTYAIGDAGENYLKSVSIDRMGHPLPGMFRWQELWDAMNRAAVETSARPWQNGDTWHCRCGAANIADVCSNCGRPRAEEWGDVPPQDVSGHQDSRKVV